MNERDAVQPYQLFRVDHLLANGIVSSRSTLRRLMRRAVDPFPQPIHIGPNSRAWDAGEVTAWVKRQKETCPRGPMPVHGTIPTHHRRTAVADPALRALVAEIVKQTIAEMERDRSGDDDSPIAAAG